MQSPDRGPAVIRSFDAQVATVGESSSVAVLDGDDVGHVARVHTRRSVTVMITVGTRFPAYATCLGQVLLAFPPERELDAYPGRDGVVTAAGTSR